MIPVEKSAAVTRGLNETFGVNEFEDISKITKGHTSSLVFRIVVRGSPYLLKIILREEDPTRHYASMNAAAEAMVAPHVLYSSVPDRVSITDYVETTPLPMIEALARLPSLLRTLHDLPPFSKAPFNTTCTFLLDKGPVLEGFLRKFQASNILPKAESDEFFRRYSELAAIYPRVEADMVSSHNDLFKPDNILFDGKRVWLVDWEAAFLNDRYADLAVVANQVAPTEEDEMAFLQRYFGAQPDRYRLARFHLMRQIAHMFYAFAFLKLGAKEGPIDWSDPVPGFRDFQRRMWAGEVDLADRDAKVVYGRVHLERLLQNVQESRYEESLAMVSERHA